MVRTTFLALIISSIAASAWAQQATQDDVDKLRREYDEKLQRYEQMLKDQSEQHRKEMQQLRDEIEKLKAQGAAKTEGGSLEDDVEKLIQQAQQAASAGEQSAGGRAVPTSGAPSAGNEFNPRITVFFDPVLRFDDAKVLNDKGHDVSDRFNFRETEADFRADVDPFAKAVVILSIPEEDRNEFGIEVEEAYALFDSLPDNLRAKVGRFRTEFGKLSFIHTHDLPQTTRPLPITTYLGPEGDIENGGSLSWLVPNPWNKAIEATFQILNGENDTILAGSASSQYAYLGHVKFFDDLTENQSIDVGVSDLFGYGDHQARDNVNLAGTDFTYKWRPLERGEYQSFLAQGEMFFLNKEVTAGPDANSFGAYAYAQYQPMRNVYFGNRWDYAEGVVDDKAQGWSTIAYVSYYTSEFLRFRLSFEHTEGDGEFAPDRNSVLIQMTVVFGSHPTEPYWVNR
ncbi:MAG: hypothetical protein HYR85_24485 [Planctomycetes bacterium]|nr:hypothetical protein [Planctomycetota bacterium]MBI3845765.1 hypothetical protein [Planctomycetota bacterium]